MNLFGITFIFFFKLPFYLYVELSSYKNSIGFPDTDRWRTYDPTNLSV